MGQDPRGRADSPRSARPRPARVSPTTYWRRRVFVFTVGIGLLTALSWTVNGVLAARSSAGRAASPGGTRAAAAGAAPAGRGGAAPPPSCSPRPQPGASPPRGPTQPYLVTSRAGPAPRRTLKLLVR